MFLKDIAVVYMYMCIAFAFDKKKRTDVNNSYCIRNKGGLCLLSMMPWETFETAINVLMSFIFIFK